MKIGEKAVDDLLMEFLGETKEGFAALTLDQTTFVANLSNADVFGKVFRVVHTIAGTSSFLDLPRLEKFAKACGEFLDDVKSGKLVLSETNAFLIYECVVQLAFIVDYLSKHRTEPAGDDSVFLEALNQTMSSQPVQQPPAVVAEQQEQMPVDVEGPFLLCKINRQLMAIPIADVKRFESFETDAIFSGPHHLQVPYYNIVMPLVSLHDGYQLKTPNQPVVIFMNPDAVGLLVDEAIDVVEDLTQTGASILNVNNVLTKLGGTGQETGNTFQLEGRYEVLFGS